MSRFETDRLVLRRWRSSDHGPFAALNADPHVMEHMPKRLTRDESDGFAADIERHFESHGYGLWAVEVKEGPPFIGFVGLSIPRFATHFTPCVEVGWRLAAEHWGHGYATEAAQQALAVGFQQFGLGEIVSFATKSNLRSHKVMERLGMTRNPTDDFNHPTLPADHPLRPHVLYRLGRDRWTEDRIRQSRL